MKTKSLWFLFALLGVIAVKAAEVIPPTPKAYFNDYAQVISPDIANELNQQLEQFERQTSIQIVVAVFPKMQSDSSVEDYTVRVAQSWGIGQKGKSNGVVLFVFTQDRKMYIQVGYGLEGALPDALAKRIIENEIKPHFRSGDYAGGLRAGVTAILQAMQGEYQGTGSAAAERTGTLPWSVPLIIVFAIFYFICRLLINWVGGTVYTRGGRTAIYSGWGGGGFSSGGGGFSGGSGFSSGGGSFGDGGAGGSW